MTEIESEDRPSSTRLAFLPDWPWRKIALWSVALTLVWPTQYLIVVPVVWVYRLIAALFKVVGVAIVLIFIPFLGWAVLYVIYSGRKRERAAERRHREQMAALAPHAVLEAAPARSITRPWLWDQLRSQVQS